MHTPTSAPRQFLGHTRAHALPVALGRTEGVAEARAAAGRSGTALELALAPALTPAGLDATPSFFAGFVAHPLVLARGLLALADVAATRYFQYVPTTQRDPVLTAHGDRLRAEVFSACNGVYARLDLLSAGFESGEIGFGTTNVDLGVASRSVLSAVRRTELLHLAVGEYGLGIATPEHQSRERPVEMPERWIRALGNVAELHRRLSVRATLDAAAARAFLGAVPPATASGRTVWLVPSRGGIRIAHRPAAGAVSVAGLHRLSAARRLLPHVTGLALYGSDAAGASAIEIRLPGARLTLGLTAEPWRGHSGEGALLTALAGDSVLADAERVSAELGFEAILDLSRLAGRTGLSPARVRGAVTVLAASGRVGWDLAEDAYFHRELPDDPARVDRDHPRLSAARALAAAGRVVAASPGAESWTVRGADPGSDSVVRRDPHGAPGVESLSCSCAWGLRHGTDRGPCKHVLAVAIVTEEPL